MKFLIITLLACFYFTSIAQYDDSSITGYIYDATTKQPILGVNILSKGCFGSITDTSGYFKMRLPINHEIYITRFFYKLQVLPIEDKKHYIIFLEREKGLPLS